MNADAIRPGGSRLPICQRLLVGDGAPDELGGDIVTMTLRNPDGFDAVDTIEALVAHIAGQSIFAQSHLIDAPSVSGADLRRSLEEMVANNRALLNKISEGRS